MHGIDCDSYLQAELMSLREFVAHDSMLKNLLNDELMKGLFEKQSKCFVELYNGNETDKFAPQFIKEENTNSGKIIYHSEVLKNQSENNIPYYTQSSLAHEIRHAQQYEAGFDLPTVLKTNAADVMALESECRMLNAMYFAKRWQQSNEDIDTLCNENAEMREGMGGLVSKYISERQKYQRENPSAKDEIVDKVAGKKVILCLLNGEDKVWKNMYFNQINNVANAQIDKGNSDVATTFSEKMIEYMNVNWGITKQELKATTMETSLNVSRMVSKSRNRLDKKMKKNYSLDKTKVSLFERVNLIKDNRCR